jgi:hypothetical protein
MLNSITTKDIIFKSKLKKRNITGLNNTTETKTSMPRAESKDNAMNMAEKNNFNRLAILA